MKTIRRISLIVLLAGCGVQNPIRPIEGEAIPNMETPNIDTHETRQNNQDEQIPLKWLWEHQWQCKEGLKLYASKPITSTGMVVLDGIEEITIYLIDGLERAWHWGKLDNGSYQYAVWLRGNTARYFNFGPVDTKAKPTSIHPYIRVAGRINDSGFS